MYSLFRLLFQSTYWRMLLRSATWREAGMSLRRAHKDKRARKHVLAFALFISVPLLCLAYLAWLAGSGALLVAPFVLPVLWWRSRRQQQDDVPLTITPKAEPVVRELLASELSALCGYFSDLALFFAVMLSRAGSETFLKEKEIPEGVEVVSRRKHLDLLQKRGIWERLEQEDRIALMAADGHWERTKIYGANYAMEPLRLLRWIMRLDFYLPDIGKQSRGDYNLAHELVREPGRLLTGTELVDWATMQVGREAAWNYYLRCMAEGIHRGTVAARNPDATRWAEEVVGRLGGKEHEDLVLGTQLVSEISDELLAWTASVADQRVHFLDWAMNLRTGGPIPHTMLRVFSPEADETAESIGLMNEI